MYLAHEAGRLAGVDGDRIGQWARWGHIRASVSDGDPHVYSFEDVADALAVRILLDAGMPLPLIRAAVEHLGGDHPLAEGIHVVDGRLAVERAGGLEDVFSEQRVLGLNGRLDPIALLRAGGWPSLMTGVAVEVDPERAAGHPCRPGTRTPVKDALEDPELRRWWECVGSGGARRDIAPHGMARRAGPPVAKRPRLLLDGGLPVELAAELRARGRQAAHVTEIGLEHATDAEALAAEGVLVTTVGLPGAIEVRGNVREAVHRHAHEMATRAPRRYVG